MLSLSSGVPWIFMVILSVQGYPYYYNNYYNNYYQRPNLYHSPPNVELKRLKRCVNQWSPDMRMYNFVQNPSFCGSTLVNDLSRITPRQLNCLMKVLDGNQNCNVWPQDVNNSPTFKTGMPNMQSRSYVSPQNHPMGPHVSLNNPPVLRPQAIHPSLLEGWVSDEEIGDLAFGGYATESRALETAPMANLMQPDNKPRLNSGSLKAGSILVIVPGKDQLEEVQRAPAPQPRFSPSLPFVSPRLQGSAMPPVPAAPPTPPQYPPPPNPSVYLPLQDDMNWIPPNKAQNGRTQMAPNIMHGNPPNFDMNSINSNFLAGGNSPSNIPFYPPTITLPQPINTQNCGPWSNPWTMGMFPYAGPCSNPSGGLFGQTFDQLHRAAEAYQKVDEPEIEINQTTTCKKKGKDGIWVPCNPEDLERNLPSLYNNNNNYGNINPTPVIPAWSGAVDKPLQQMVQIEAVDPNQAPSYAGGQVDPAVQGVIQSGGFVPRPPFPHGFRPPLTNLGQPFTGSPFAVTQRTTPITPPNYPPPQGNSQLANKYAPSLGGLGMNLPMNIGQNFGYPTTSNPYNQALPGNFGVTSNYAPQYESGSVGSYKAAYDDINSRYASLGPEKSIANLPPDHRTPSRGLGQEREGMVFAQNSKQDKLVSTERPGRSLAPLMQHDADKYNMNSLMGQGYGPMFIPSKSIPAIPLYNGFNMMGNPSRSMNMMPYGQPFYMPQMVPGGRRGPYSYFMNSPVAHGNPQNSISPGWVPMKIERSPQPADIETEKVESPEYSSTEDSIEIEDSNDESEDY
ncbi:unnamed protein product [Meganyctiphanes norvegica]|uniref:Uncharacterized protein n=1 Tax=Meganyctiphanes norvegica TaxID=48144 RepID=A0AAV2QBT1_MEGNR